MPPVWFEPEIPASDMAQTLALDRSAFGFGSIFTLIYLRFLETFPLHCDAE